MFVSKEDRGSNYAWAETRLDRITHEQNIICTEATESTWAELRYRSVALNDSLLKLIHQVKTIKLTTTSGYLISWLRHPILMRTFLVASVSKRIFRGKPFI